MIWRFMIFFLLLHGAVFASVEKPVVGDHFVSIADLHFDPFVSCTSVPCPLIMSLEKAPISEWERLLSNVEKASGPEDTDQTLFLSAKQDWENQNQLMNIDFVIILGDWLAHNYFEKYRYYSQEMDAESYQFFVNKTLSYLVEHIKKAFPNQSVFFVLGNNDSYTEDYAVDPAGPFYSNMGKIAGALLSPSNLKEKIQMDFTKGGYYAVDIPDSPKIRLIVLNSVIFSAKAKGANREDLAKAQLAFLHEELAHVAQSGQKALIAMHIPAGMDVYASIKWSAGIIPVPLWESAYNDTFEKELADHANDILMVLSAHFHMDFFQSLFQGTDHPVLVSGTPAISSLFGNLPAYKIYTYNKETPSIDNFTSRIQKGSENAKWEDEYDFLSTYQAGSVHPSIQKGMEALQKEGSLKDKYLAYYAASGITQPISFYWDPLYWCQMHYLNLPDYTACLNGIK